MNLLVSYDWLKEYVDVKETPEQFAARISLSGPGVERWYPQGDLFKGMIVGHVEEVKSHPQADKLRVAMVDVGQKKLSIVCGGSNLVQDQWVAVALVGAKVKWHGEGDLIELKPAEIRGVKSEGMICAASEIGLFEAFPHGEKEILDLKQALPEKKLKAGMSLAEALEVAGDTVMDTEVTTNRPDAMGMVGMAREASAILKRPFLWKPAPRIKEGKDKLKISVEDQKLCPRFMAVRLEGVKVGPSPWWMKRRLMAAGIRPINNLVDITNYVMLELARPMHVFDADKMHGNLRVRFAKKGESIKALDGETYALGSQHVVIADDQGPQSIAGIMGGEVSGVSDQTQNIIFECAVWDPVNIRRTSRDLNLKSEAQALFEKGLSTQSTMDGLARSVELCQQLAGGKVVSTMFDSGKGNDKPLKYSMKISDINTQIGVTLPIKDMVSTLQHLGFIVKKSAGKITATVPWWRDHDIETPRDLVEEIARVHGYVNLPAVFPVGMSATSPLSELFWEDRVKTIAQGAGLTEVYTYSFVSESLLRKGDFDPSKLLRVQNEWSSDFVYMRTNLLPSLLEVVAENQERFPEQQLFEVSHAYFPHHAKQTELPDERLMMSAAFVGSEDVWRQAKGFAEHLYQELGIRNQDIVWKKLEENPFWHPGRTVQAFVGKILIGTMGEIHPLLRERFGIDKRVALMDVPLEEVFACASPTKQYIPLPLYPEAKRDVALLLRKEVEIQTVSKRLREASSFLQKVEWFDTYRGQGIPADKKSVALHLTFVAPDRTLETKEVDEMMESMAKLLKQEFEATIRA